MCISVSESAARPIHLTQNVNDDTVPQFQSEENVALLESLPEKYEIKGGVSNVIRLSVRLLEDL